MIRSFENDYYLMELFYIVYVKLSVEACRFNLWKMPRVFDRCYKIKMKQLTCNENNRSKDKEMKRTTKRFKVGQQGKQWASSN